MLEALNSVISNASMLRASAEQVDVARSFAANPERVQEVPMAPYISPYIHVDTNYNQAVLQLRNASTGDVEAQIPSEERLAQIRNAEQRRQLSSLEENTGGGQDAKVVSQQIASDTGSLEGSSGGGVQPVNAQQIAAFEAGAQTAQGGTAHVNVDA